MKNHPLLIERSYMIVIAYALMMIDYILTKIALKTDFCYEGNPLMRWLTNMPIFPGILIRAAICAILLIPFYLVRQQSMLFYKVSMSVVILMNLVAMVLHGIWIVEYIKKG